MNRRRRYRFSLPAHSRRRSRTEQAARPTRWPGHEDRLAASSSSYWLSCRSWCWWCLQSGLAARLPFVRWALGFAMTTCPLTWRGCDEGNAMLRPSACFNGRRRSRRAIFGGAAARRAPRVVRSYFALAGPAVAGFAPSAVARVDQPGPRSGPPAPEGEVITDGPSTSTAPSCGVATVRKPPRAYWQPPCTSPPRLSPGRSRSGRWR